MKDLSDDWRTGDELTEDDELPVMSRMMIVLIKIDIASLMNWMGVILGRNLPLICICGLILTVVMCMMIPTLLSYVVLVMCSSSGQQLAIRYLLSLNAHALVKHQIPQCYYSHCH